MIWSQLLSVSITLTVIAIWMWYVKNVSLQNDCIILYYRVKCTVSKIGLIICHGTCRKSEVIL